MAGRAKRATELRELAELVADTLTNFDAAKYAADPEHYYRPTILSGGVAAAYDAAMARARCPVRAWRSSKATSVQCPRCAAALKSRTLLVRCDLCGGTGRCRSDVAERWHAAEAA